MSINKEDYNSLVFPKWEEIKYNLVCVDFIEIIDLLIQEHQANDDLITWILDNYEGNMK